MSHPPIVHPLDPCIDLAQAVSRRALMRLREGHRELVISEEAAPDTRSWAFLIDPQATTNAVTVCATDFQALIDAADGFADQLGLDATPAPQVTASDDELTIDQHQIGATNNPVIRFVTSMLFDALRSGASDIHLESTEHGLQAKQRIDGVLLPTAALNARELGAQVVSRIKVLAMMDISEHRIPQDGRFRARFEQRWIDIRVSVMPSVFGEDVVMRVLDREHLAKSLQGLTLAKLGFDETIVAQFKKLCAASHGLVLVTGPTGSGKTTSLYAAIAETRKPTEKVITIEDPVEYQLDGALQIPVNERKGLTFATGLRSILRHDPDRILIGEVRDSETTQIAIQSALTGHVVYATVHANGVFDVISRLNQLGADPLALSTALTGVMAQRLVRLTCDACDGAAQSLVGTPCPRCRGTGFRGRRAIGELLAVTPAIRGLIGEQAPMHQLHEATDFVSLRAQAQRLVTAKLTTQAEADRVTGTD